jgi:hypothetical protein
VPIGITSTLDARHRWLQRASSACRFFLVRSEFEEECALYRDPVLRRALPDLLHADANAAGALRSRGGTALPPFIVLERGTTLKAWREYARGYGEVRNVYVHHSMGVQVASMTGACHCQSCKAKVDQPSLRRAWRLSQVQNVSGADDARS